MTSTVEIVTTFPERVYLARSSSNEPFTDDTEWGDNRETLHDIEYVRADVVEKLLKRAKNPFRAGGVPCRVR